MISRFDEGSLASEAARCLRQLGQLLLASVLIAQGQPEQAYALAEEVLDATQPLSSYLVIQQLRELARDLEPYQATRP